MKYIYDKSLVCVVFIVCVTGISFGLYQYFWQAKPFYFDAPIPEKQILEDENSSEYDENNALEMLQRMDEEGLDFAD